MAKKKAPVDPADELRKRAAKIAGEKAASSPENIKSATPAEISRLLQELQIHQIELEMQNEELRRMQLELEASQKKHFELYDLAPVGYLTLNASGLILDANLKASTLLGVSRDDLIKKPLNSFILPEDQDKYYLYYRNLVVTHTPQECELRMMQKEGCQFWARIQANIAEEADNAILFRAVISDITERKNAEEMIEHLASFPQLNPNPVIETDLNGQIIFYNTATMTILKELKAKEDIRLFLPRDLKEILNKIEQCNGPQYFSREVEINGMIFAESIILLTTLKVVRIFAQNITEGKLVEKELTAHSQKLEQTNAAQKVLLHNREQSLREIEKKFLANIKKLVFPYVKELRELHLTPRQSTYLDIIDTHLQLAIDPFLQNLTARFSVLTPREIQIASLTKEGKTNKEIADLLNVERCSINFHRRNIRKKMGLTGRKSNLRAFLRSLSE